MARRKAVLLDTSPIITLASFRLGKETLLERLVPATVLYLPASVAAEATANRKYADAVHIHDMMKQNAVRVLAVRRASAAEPIQLYAKLGQGERDTIYEATFHKQLPPVLDDHLALVVAQRFGLRPLLLLDLIADLARTGHISKQQAQAIVRAIRPRYSDAFVDHTLFKLDQLP
jgi:predicted nucleic acid-binding protein